MRVYVSIQKLYSQYYFNECKCIYIYIYIHVYICICIHLRTFTCSLWSWKMLKVPRDDHERICVVFFRLLLRMDHMDHQHFIVPGGALVFLTHFPCKPCFTYRRWFFLGNCCWKPYMANPEKCNIEPRGLPAATFEHGFGPTQFASATLQKRDGKDMKGSLFWIVNRYLFF